ncbi:Polymeric immunoglobulin receptor [Channa argus]|uniref:polymeric immunoglobulin receptor-like isoform X1 n=1 Tax=Channa argus TaxID=215402 RepID=UPI0014179103|nr:Polymeric immunoglobulin receptor [Channa argus]
MKIHHILFCCFLSALMDANTSITIYQKKEGTNFKIQWQLPPSESTKFLCRNECKDDDILIKTKDNRAENGSYTIEYKNTSSSKGVLHVNIKNLTKSDSGRYRCGLGTFSLYREFEVRVVNAQEKEINIHVGNEGEKVSVACYFTPSNSTKYFCKGGCKNGTILVNTTGDQDQRDRYSITYGQESVRKSVFLRVTITQLNKLDSGQYTCGLGESLSSASFQSFEICVTDNSSNPPCTFRQSLTSDPPPSSEFTVLLLTLITCVPVAVVLLTVVLLALQRLKPTKKSKRRDMDVTLLAVTYENDIFMHSQSDGQSINEESATF